MKFEIGQLVCHIGVQGKKFIFIGMIGPSQCEIKDVANNRVLVEPIECILDIIESRNNIINFIIDEKS